MIWLCVSLSAALIIMLLAYFRLKRVLRQLTAQVSALAEGETEKTLDLALIDHDLEQLAGALNRLNDRQRQAVAAAHRHEDMLKESVANISHDLRTPLTVILGHLQLLARASLAPEEARRLVTIRSKAEAMQRLVDSFYELSLLEDDHTPIKRTRFNLTNLLLDLLAEQAPVFEARGLTPEIDLPEHTVFVISDRILLERILQNLLTNAQRYAAGSVCIALTETDGAVRLMIANPVADPTVLDPTRLFDRFYTADPARSNGATGLRLAVVKILAERLGGSVCASLDGDELTITLVL